VTVFKLRLMLLSVILKSCPSYIVVSLMFLGLFYELILSLFFMPIIKNSLTLFILGIDLSGEDIETLNSLSPFSSVPDVFISLTLIMEPVKVFYRLPTNFSLFNSSDGILLVLPVPLQDVVVLLVVELDF
jgi:hypothetical protein